MDLSFGLDSDGRGRYRPATRPKNLPFGLIESFVGDHPGLSRRDWRNNAQITRAESLGPAGRPVRYVNS